MESKKSQVILALYEICKDKKEFVFDNALVKSVSEDLGFGNPFDVTKLDNKSKLPKYLKDNDLAIIHLGNGRHKFVKGIDKVYHDFEPITAITDWTYQKSILNQYNSSESNILSVANNQRILHKFLFGKDTEFDDVCSLKRPKTYFPHRTKTSFAYSFGGENVELQNIQIKIDLTIEFCGTVGVFEAKNGHPDNFVTYNLYHSFLYYYNANLHDDLKGKIKDIFCVYVVREVAESGDIIRLWAYTFTRPLDITSIQLVKSAGYKLINV